jgi:hypothetical protein
MLDVHGNFFFIRLLFYFLFLISNSIDPGGLKALDVEIVPYIHSFKTTETSQHNKFACTNRNN